MSWKEKSLLCSISLAHTSIWIPIALCWYSWGWIAVLLFIASIVCILSPLTDE